MAAIAARARPKRRVSVRQRVGKVASYLVLVLLAVVGVAPFAVLLLISFKSRLDVLEVPPSLHINWDDVRENYNEVWNNRGYPTFIKNSFIVTFGSTLIAIVIGVPAAYAFSRLRFRGRERWASTVLSFRFMPPIAVAIPIYLMIRMIGLYDSYLGLILPYVAFSLPLVVWIMIGFFDEIPMEIDDAARVDGCTRVSVLARVVLPLVRPGIAVSAIFSAMFIWNEFLVGLFVIGDQKKLTVPIAAATLLTSQHPIDWNIAATVGVLTVIPVLIFALLSQRFIVRGITAGSIK
jgi:multiple sugar transport system permease protein